MMPGKIGDLIRVSTGEGYGKVPKNGGIRASTGKELGQVPKNGGIRASTENG